MGAGALQGGTKAPNWAAVGVLEIMPSGDSLAALHAQSGWSDLT